MKFVELNDKEWLERQGYSKKILLNEGDLKSRGNVVQIIKNKANSEIKPHYHKNMIEIYHIIEGSAIVFCGKKRIRTKINDTVLCEPGEIHGVVNDTSNDFKILVFKINANDKDIYWVE